MGQALYRKYRSKSLSEIVGQEHITRALSQAIKTDRISHAYLFTGPRGVGKTSIARIIAHQINDLPYESDESHLDIIEIDAASNRRIDEIRDLREKVYVAPTSARYKVYIIDEVHMLTREAFNALLKTLEEPPEHVVFILATTDAHKLPATIISRTQRYSFKPVPARQVMAHLRQIAKAEKIQIDDDALSLIAEHGEGAMRDSIGLLDQIGNQDSSVKLADVQLMLGIPPLETLNDIVKDLGGQSAGEAMEALSKLYEQGYQATAIAKQLGQVMRRQVAAGQLTLGLPQTFSLLGKLLEVAASHDPERYLEIILLEAATPSLALKQQLPSVAVATDQTPTPTPRPQVDEPKPTAKVSKQQSAVSQPRVAQPAPRQSSSASELDESIWPQILARLKQTYNTIYGIVRMAQPSFSEPGVVELTFAFAFHQKRISDAKNRKIVADAIEAVTGQKVEIICLVDKEMSHKKPAGQTVTAATVNREGSLDTISNIFGGGELLES